MWKLQVSEIKGLTCRRSSAGLQLVIVSPSTCTAGYCNTVSTLKGMAGAAVLRSLRILRPRTLATSGRFLHPGECVLFPASCVLYPPWRSSPARSLQVCSALCAGHNKWSKVKNIKGPKDMARCKMFMKFALLIKVAVKGKIFKSLKDNKILHIHFGAFHVSSLWCWCNLQKGEPTQGWM